MPEFKCSCGEPIRDAQCFNCGERHDNYGFDNWPKMPAAEPVPESSFHVQQGE